MIYNYQIRTAKEKSRKKTYKTNTKKSSSKSLGPKKLGARSSKPTESKEYIALVEKKKKLQRKRSRLLNYFCFLFFVGTVSVVIWLVRGYLFKDVQESKYPKVIEVAVYIVALLISSIFLKMTLRHKTKVLKGKLSTRWIVWSAAFIICVCITIFNLTDHRNISPLISLPIAAAVVFFISGLQVGIHENISVRIENIKEEINKQKDDDREAFERKNLLADILVAEAERNDGPTLNISDQSTSVHGTPRTRKSIKDSEREEVATGSSLQGSSLQSVDDKKDLNEAPKGLVTDLTPQRLGSSFRFGSAVDMFIKKNFRKTSKTSSVDDEPLKH